LRSLTEDLSGAERSEASVHKLFPKEKHIVIERRMRDLPLAGIFGRNAENKARSVTPT
jgi:hypothetical protein